MTPLLEAISIINRFNLKYHLPDSPRALTIYTVTMKIYKCFAIIGLLAIFFSACTDEESTIGMGLQDPATLYNGKTDTLYCSAATMYDDSLYTKGFGQGTLGYYADNTFGSVKSSIYTQIACTSVSGVDYANSTIDSVVLSLAISDYYPLPAANAASTPLNFEIYQLAQTISNDSTRYYANSSVPVSSQCFYKGTVRVNASTDTVIRIKLNSNIIRQIEGKTFATNTEFNNYIKGIRIRLLNERQPIMLTVNFAAAKTKLTVYRVYNESNNDTTHMEDGFAIGTGAIHFNRFEHHYAGALSSFNTNRNVSIGGSRYLYLDPMGGTKLRLNFDNSIKAFRAQHPFAIIHYAELLMPVATDMADKYPPDALMAFKHTADSTLASLPDYLDQYRYTGFDGAYNPTQRLYRLRVTQHLQKLLRLGTDYGTFVVVEARRASAKRTVLNGSSLTETGNNPVRIVFVYTEQ